MQEPEIVFIDNHVLVANKPAGMITQPDSTSQLSLEEWCKAYVKVQFNKPGAVFLHALHRLDKPVSGLVLFARTSKALSRLNVSMRSNLTSKTYIATVKGQPSPAEGVLEHYLLHGDHCAEICGAGHPQGKKARLRYRILQKLPNQSILEINLETGRYHQIRIQLAAIGHPIIGDTRYGYPDPLPGGVIALKHARFSFPHPISGQIINLSLTD